MPRCRCLLAVSGWSAYSYWSA